MEAAKTYEQISSIHSPGARSFTLFVRTDGTWAVPSVCHLTVNPSTDPAGNTFFCQESLLDLPTRDWTRPGEELVQALVMASQNTLPNHRTY
jgi:hypothetical protein